MNKSLQILEVLKLIPQILWSTLTSIMSPKKNSSASPLSYLQETELIFINPSPGPKVGPNPRVINRKNGYYMWPRSPASPTLCKIWPRVSHVAGSWEARMKDDYTMTESKGTQNSAQAFSNF